MNLSPDVLQKKRIAADVLLHEFDFVESLIPMYRKFQMELIRFSLLVYTALITAAVSLQLEARTMHLLAICVPFLVAMFLFAFITTEIRIIRASAHISNQLAEKLHLAAGCTGLVSWENSPGTHLRRWERCLSTSASMIFALGLPAVVMSILHLIFFDQNEHYIEGIASYTGLILLGISMILAIVISASHEHRNNTLSKRSQSTNPSNEKTSVWSRIRKYLCL